VADAGLELMVETHNADVPKVRYLMCGVLREQSSFLDRVTWDLIARNVSHRLARKEAGC
jgi:hypothetical protein